MPKASDAVDLIQQQLLSICVPENAQVVLSAHFVECLTRFEDPLEPELPDDGLLCELKLTRQEGVLYDQPIQTRWLSREPSDHFTPFN
jgi:hypothetical protein